MKDLLNDHNVLEILQIVGSAAGMLVAWAVADGRSKARLAHGEERIRELSANCVTEQHETDVRLKALEVHQARSEIDRSELRKTIEKLEVTKASKEMLDSFKNELTALKSDMDKRFDKIEDLLRGNQ